MLSVMNLIDNCFQMNERVNSDKPLVSRQYLLEKYPGKGGWTYAAIPEILQDKHAWFGWVKVRGSIDSYEIKNYNLMPMGNGTLFLPVKSEIRKKIGKQAGDMVTVILYADKGPTDIPEELMVCLQSDQTAYNVFMGLSDGEKKWYVEWIYSAKKEETKIDRIAQMLNKLSGISK